MTSVTRRYHFSASHRLHAPSLTSEANDQLYGKCNNPYGHGHDYILEVTVTGSVDPTTGLLVRTAELDQLVRDNILSVFSGRNINLDIPAFRSLVPTTENIVMVISQILERRWAASSMPSGARLSRVQVQETGRNGFELLIKTPASVTAQVIETEYVRA